MGEVVKVVVIVVGVGVKIRIRLCQCCKRERLWDTVRAALGSRDVVRWSNEGWPNYHHCCHQRRRMVTIANISHLLYFITTLGVMVFFLPLLYTFTLRPLLCSPLFSSFPTMFTIIWFCLIQLYYLYYSSSHQSLLYHVCYCYTFWFVYVFFCLGLKFLVLKILSKWNYWQWSIEYDTDTNT